MKTLFQRALGSALLLTSLTQVACGSANELVEMGTPAAAGLRLVTPSAQEVLPEEARAAIVEAATTRSGLKGPISLINLRWEGTWALGTLTVADLDKPLPEGHESHLSFDNLYAVVLVRTGRGWEAALEGDTQAAALLELPQAGAEPGLEEESPALAATVESTKERTPRWDWAGLLCRTESAGCLRLLWVWRPQEGAGIPDGSPGCAPFWSTWHCPRGLLG